ncbi:DUF4239 domain-containing protein [Streptomyces sp. VRA16 Mangrove soil]|uniref:bestrophin-like domain n=1 Tax=Streptomyces sp. VRA16 Mangrove soil TaxID=2817434 RepID=UPI001A9E1B58|nr:DUF4239 domain-containing protein [Streptomyces sp. VRA16 Mangrove soil]MBO1336858.1 DUF4239 domain-containing protein [Streptomyces sp. VRA16 Mangrove soil]
MGIWLLNHFSTLVLAALLGGGAVVLALAGCVLVRRRFPRLATGAYNEMIGVVLGMYAAIYGIILAFVVVAEWEGLGEAQTNVAAEASQTAEVLRDASAFPPRQHRKVVGAMDAYVHAVVDKQWPLMRTGSPDPGLTNPEVVRLYTVFQSYEPRTEAQKTYYTQAVTTLGVIAEARRTRLSDAEQSLPMLLDVLVYGGALVMLPLTFLYGIESLRAQLMFVASVAALIGVSLLLCLTLDHPFAGDLAVSPQPFKEGVLAQFWS